MIALKNLKLLKYLIRMVLLNQPFCYKIFVKITVGIQIV